MKEIVISSNPNRNHRMVVYHNVGSDGKKYSLTRHEPIDRSKPCIRRPFKGKTS